MHGLYRGRGAKILIRAAQFVFIATWIATDCDVRYGGRKLCQRVGLLGRWEAVTGPTHTIAIRSDDPLWQQLTATENVRKDVEITGLLQSTTTFRVSGVTVVR
jgi:hypothetical protein